ncbi:hypothetical protein D3C81_605820 [compost metagenome]
MFFPPVPVPCSLSSVRWQPSATTWPTSRPTATAGRRWISPRAIPPMSATATSATAPRSPTSVALPTSWPSRACSTAMANWRGCSSCPAWQTAWTRCSRMRPRALRACGRTSLIRSADCPPTQRAQRTAATCWTAPTRWSGASSSSPTTWIRSTTRSTTACSRRPPRSIGWLWRSPSSTAPSAAMPQQPRRICWTAAIS